MADNEENKQQQAPAESRALTELQPIIQALPPDKQQQTRQLFIKAFRETRFSGPLPSPTMLREYGSIVPDFPERIVKKWELEQQHRHEQENKLVSAHVRISERGQHYGAALCVLFAALGVFLALNGHPLLAGTIFTTTLVAVITVFVLGRTASQGGGDEGEPPPQKKKKKR